MSGDNLTRDQLRVGGGGGGDSTSVFFRLCTGKQFKSGFST